MSGIADVLTDNMVKSQSMTQRTYDELIIARKELNDLHDLITVKVSEKKGLSFYELKLLYDLKIRVIKSESEETSCN